MGLTPNKSARIGGRSPSSSRQLTISLQELSRRQRSEASCSEIQAYGKKLMGPGCLRLEPEGEAWQGRVSTEGWTGPCATLAALVVALHEVDRGQGVECRLWAQETRIP